MNFPELPSVTSGAAWIPLADAIVKTTVLLATAGLTSFILRRRSAAMRHVVWTLALLGALALPVLSIALPRWQLDLVTISQLSASSSELPASSSARPASSFELPAPSAMLPVAAPQLPASGSQRPAVAARLPREAGNSELAADGWQRVALLIWTLGAAAILGRLALGLVGVQWMSRRTERVTDAPWLPLARALATELGVSPRIVFLRSGRAAMPYCAPPC
jgi:bla regulator protein blaR1